MENSFLGGSENLYKYLVTIGLLLIVGAIYYPLKEKQSLELLKIELGSEAQKLAIKVQKNQKFSEDLKRSKINVDYKENLQLSNLLHEQNQIDQLESEKKLAEMQNRSWYICVYNILFWIFFPIGILLCIYGFIKWNAVKKIDDEIKELELKKLKIELKRLETP